LLEKNVLVGNHGETKLSKEWDFLERLNFSEGREISEGILEHLKDITPKAINIRKATENEDRHGTDYWIERKNLPPLSVDLKNREFCPIERFGSDDACIETCSVYTGPPKPPWYDYDKFRIKSGWTIDENKRTDIIVYTWPILNSDKLRFWILYFPWLCKASQNNWKKWRNIYPERPAENRDYVTLSIYPLRKVIVQEIRNLLTGELF